MKTATTGGLVENKGVRQRPEEGFRRWFLNEFFDLILWYDRRDGKLTGFQFCYGKPYAERAYMWSAGRQGHHMVSDSHDGGALHAPATAVLHGDGGLVPETVIERFRREAGDLSPRFVDLIVERLRSYNKSRR